MPIDPEQAWEFDPDAVPTVASLLTQLNQGTGGAAVRAVGPSVCSVEQAIVALAACQSFSCSAACFTIGSPSQLQIYLRLGPNDLDSDMV